MSNSIAIDSDVSRLHPAIRDAVATVRKQLQSEKIPFEVFEAFRTPERQSDLYAQGRTRPGDKVTWALPWQSMHQYGLAVDFVLRIGDKWSWDDSGPEAAYWTRLHELARAHGMTPLFNSKGKLIEKPHIQLVGLSSARMQAGDYPAGGDAVWADHLTTLIANWKGTQAPPPRPNQTTQRPAIAEEDIAEFEQSHGSDVANSTTAAIEAVRKDPRFQQLHAFIKRWEGGFVNDPRDNGGATNMGITQATLADWRGRPVSVEEVSALGRDEADAILRTNYYSRCRCAELPDRVAMVLYNGAVLHGPKAATRFLQRAFNGLGLQVDGAPLVVDGDIGKNTMAAARQTDPAILAAAFMDVQEAHHRGHEDFAAFGNGWLNRLASLREFVTGLPAGEGERPKRTATVGVASAEVEPSKGTSTDRAEIERVLNDILRDRSVELGGDAQYLQLMDELKALAAQLASSTASSVKVVPAAPESSNSDSVVAVGRPLDVTKRPPLTPVNAALGEGIGKLLNGKKSIIGIVGLLATVLLPEIGLSGPIVDFVERHGTELTTILATFTGWGFLGKIDKAIWSLER
ncbi:hypothetical protein P775_16690 [Puniceibacterium antarcticum]|uniref:Uncharacterized protein n=1 Tax=Puniceibacterium antarcticum TaxID=1206336 RepID=A0A2G8RBU2_9RHOB|nr:glycosyl hydrolase 108 family protein [Puniceibacterium antarcticum]PIL19000.1 hypothetical protein P775_16690 [Puniceibacterium antarcticum]